MTAPNPFDAAPDPALGEALRDALTAPDEPAFLATFRAAVAREPRRGSLEILARWASPAVAAAVFLLTLASLWVTRSLQRSDDTPVAEELSAQVILAGPSAADPVLSAMLDGR